MDDHRHGGGIPLAPMMSCGVEIPRDAPMTVVVLGVDAPPEIRDAVDSLLAQDIPLEIVIVNSGGGNLAECLGDQRRRSVATIEVPETRMPGSARNLGIAHSRAPIVSFLASDCRAGAGWARERLARHRAGAAAVASALLPAAPDHKRPVGLVAWSSHIALFIRRMPEMPAEEALRYGASYDRTLFDRYGLFREDLRTGEDTEFNRRLPANAQPAWAPAVVTEHRSPANIAAMVGDQFMRGRRTALTLLRLKGIVPWWVAGTFVTRTYLPMRLCWRHVTGPRWHRVRWALLLLPVAAAAFSLGVVSGSIRSALRR